MENRSLVCERRHCFDLSAKGYVNLAPGHDQAADKYDAALFESRARIFAGGFLHPCGAGNCNRDCRCAAFAVDWREAAADPAHGGCRCGEGYYARALARHNPQSTVVGVDLPGRYPCRGAAGACAWLAGSRFNPASLAVHSVQVLLDVLTPADYREFARVLAPAGLLVKVIPADDYLIEIAAPLPDSRITPILATRVIAHLEENAEVVARRTVRQTLPVTPEQAADFYR